MSGDLIRAKTFKKRDASVPNCAQHLGIALKYAVDVHTASYEVSPTEVGLIGYAL